MDKIEKYLDLTIEDVFADRFGRYSKYIIQERALPDVRDGLKPVQRRIMYAMYKDKNTYDKQFRKSAKTVGNVIGNYHPHGDTSVYDAMVRMSQDWKVNEQIVEMHGNNGSIDGDNPAAMRYTEAKLSEYANFMLNDIDQNVVMMVPNFDDTTYEPSVLPAGIPNLLINGTSGIASGYATDIPPHNSVEVIKAAIFLNKNDEATLSQIMRYIKGPDFPTGGVIFGRKDIVKAYQTGRGKIIMQAKYELLKDEILITEIPFNVNKAVLLQKIESLKLDKKIEGINEIIDQSDLHGVEISITLTKGSDAQLIMNYLLKNTDLQKNFNFNMIAINDKKPELMGLKDILLAFLGHREAVILKRSETLLEKSKYRLHILEGLIRAITNLDLVVAIIRKSLDKQDAKTNLKAEFNFTEEQAEAIVMMQLYRLTNTDIESLQTNHKELEEKIKYLTSIIEDRDVLIQTIEDELVAILDKIKTKRKTKVQDEYEEIVINKEDLIKEEKNIVVLTHNKYLKRTSLRSYLTAKAIPQTLEGDYITNILQVTTKDKLLVIYDNGQYALVPTYDIEENKWKDMGKPIAGLIKGGELGNIVNVIKVDSDTKYITTVTNKGYVSKILLEEFETNKLKARIKFQGLKADDQIVSATATKDKDDVIFLTDNDKYFIVDERDIELINIKRMGKKIKGINKKEALTKVATINKELLLFSETGYYFRIDKDKLMDNHFKFELLFENMKAKPQAMNYVLTDPTSLIDIYQLESMTELELSKLTKSDKKDKIRNIQAIDYIQYISDEIQN